MRCHITDLSIRPRHITLVILHAPCHITFMEHPLCKICSPPRRHKMGEDHVFPGSVRELVDAIAPKPRPRKLPPALEAELAVLKAMPDEAIDTSDIPELVTAPKNRIAARSGTDDKAGLARAAASSAVGDDPWVGCPHCEARRAALRKATARHRAKKLGRPFEESE